MFMCMPLVEFMYLVFICILSESYCRQFRCLSKCQLPLYFVMCATVPQSRLTYTQISSGMWVPDPTQLARFSASRVLTCIPAYYYFVLS